jgi:hypothetical protein
MFCVVKFGFDCAVRTGKANNAPHANIDAAIPSVTDARIPRYPRRAMIGWRARHVGTSQMPIMMLFTRKWSGRLARRLQLSTGRLEGDNQRGSS